MAGEESRSDPSAEKGSLPSPRGGGPLFGRALVVRTAVCPAVAGVLWPAGAGGETALAAAQALRPLKFSELYSGGGVRGLIFSDLAKSLAGQQVTMVGYMAPPLKPSLDFFVLTKQPMSICPFCSTDADWPNDIVLVLVKRSLKALPGEMALRVTGRLELGSRTDPETGFVSQVRLYAEKIEPNT